MQPKIGIIRFGGITWIIAGLLFLVQYLLLLPLPNPPAADADLLAWLQDWRFNLAMADEVLFFAALSLIPSIVALYHVLVKVNPILTWLGCGLLAVIIPVYIVLDIMLGRLVYPVYELPLSPETYRLMLSVYYGGMHAVAIILSIATILLSLTIGKSVIGKPAAYLGIAAGVMDLIGAYPWLLGKPVIVAAQLLCSAWFVVLGVRMLRRAGDVD